MAGGPVVANAAPDPTAVPSPLKAGPGIRMKAGVRPRHPRPAPNVAAGRLHATVTLTERQSSETVVELHLGDGSQILAALGEDAVFGRGAAVCLAFDPYRAHPFAA